MQLSEIRDAMADEVSKDLDRRFRKPLIIYFRRRLAGRSEDAEDLTQEVFVRLAQRPDRNNGETIEAYVFTIASNILSNWHRSRLSRRADAHENLDHVTEADTFPSILIEDRSPERVLESRESLQLLEKALLQLHERTRDIFLLSRIDGVSHQEIGRRFGISVSAVEKHMLKALTHIRRALP